MKTKSIEGIIIFLTNTLGSIVLAGYFLTSAGIINMIIGAYFILNIICFFCVITDCAAREEIYKDVIGRIIDEKKQSSDIHQG